VKRYLKIALVVTAVVLIYGGLGSACNRIPDPTPVDTPTFSPFPEIIPDTSPSPGPILAIPTPEHDPAPEPDTQNLSLYPAEAENYSHLEWHQDAHDPARTGYTQEEPSQPWRLLWTWNGPDHNGAAGDHFYDAPPEARSVTGGCCVFVPAGEQGLFALQKQDGHPLWNFSPTSFNAAPAFDPDNNFLYTGGGNGVLYKLDSHSGAIAGEYQAATPFNKALLLADGYVYAISSNGNLHKVNMETMTPAWVYSASSEASTPAAYSTSYGLVIYATADLQVHAVDVQAGSARWKNKPGPHEPSGSTHTFEGYWPVVADSTGIVFVRINLGMSALWSGPLENNIYPESNRATRQHLEDHPQLQNLYALSLEDGSPAFIPAVGYGGVERIENSSKELAGGPPPVIRRLEDGSEVAYSFFRSGQSKPPDGRWDSHIGEMVLDDQTIQGMQAGDLRFISFENSFTHITDEQCPLTMAGDTIFHAHWGASESIQIQDRSMQLGWTYSDPIPSQAHPVIVRRMQACTSYDPQSHWTSCDLILYSDGRTWKGPGWWVYWDILDPPTPPGRAYSEGHSPRYTYVSDGLVIVSGNGGELMVFQHSSPES
jgi:outer membrane protein assembly factor BamB